MKKIYIIPSFLVVALQHQSLICQSIREVTGNADMNYVGSDEDYDGEIRTKEARYLWDEEW